MGFGIVAMIVALALCGLSVLMERNSQKSDRSHSRRKR